MTTPVDITNRALQLLGTRTTVTSLNENSTEAIQANLVFNSVRDWCLGLNNWNFARRTATLALSKSIPPPPLAGWTSADPSLPWLFQYVAPVDALIIRYVTNAALNPGATAYAGEPQRFVVAVDSIAAVDTHVVLTSQPAAICIYTAQMADPTFWPWLFERFVVATLAQTLCLALTGDKELLQYLDSLTKEYMVIAIESNRREGLEPTDTTPEWIQALGMNYPYRRGDGKPSSKEKSSDDDR